MQLLLLMVVVLLLVLGNAKKNASLSYSKRRS